MNLTPLRDRALDLSWRPVAALLAIPFFALYFGGVVGGSVLQGMMLPGAHMGWGQQIGGLAAVVLGVALIRGRRRLLALFGPERPWFTRTVLVGLSIAAADVATNYLINNQPQRHGLEYFAYQATMPGLSEELGFRGLVLGVLVAALGKRCKSTAQFAAILLVAAAPFAALHILERRGYQLILLFIFTLYAGFALGWLRVTTGSLFVAMLAHNLANVVSGLVDNLLAPP
ncbi:MAG: CPBP family intramembrane metalloprotease [Alphaproteobacteria bacterium]|nr:MAG: CPBP family intramembrane metalloprotease [Alphaproteobacteria bacterium]